MSRGRKKSTRPAEIICPQCLVTMKVTRAKLEEIAATMGLTVSDSSPNASLTPTKKRDPIKENLQKKNALYQQRMRANVPRA